MNQAEITALCRMVSYICPSQKIDQYTPDAWGLLLADLDATDATTAVTNLGRMPLEPGRSRYIEPGHIRAEVSRIRAGRLDQFDAITEPPPGAGDTATGYLAWLRSERRRVASGHPPISPAHQLVSRPIHDAINAARYQGDPA